MPIRDADRRLRTLGKIRLGDQQPDRQGKDRPHKLTAPRLTSPTRDYLDAAALVYGGEVQAWEGAPGEGAQWELYCTADTLDIVIPPISQSHSDWYEMWSAGGCQRRCDGFKETLTGGDCLCPADKEERRTKAAKGHACKMTTRLSVLLPKVPDVGVWMIESHGYYAWAEIGGVAEFLSAKAPDAWVPGRLRLDARTAKRKDADGKTVTLNFVVPVIELPQVTAQALGSGSRPTAELGRPVTAIGPANVDPETGEIMQQEADGPPPFTDENELLMASDRLKAFVVAMNDHCVATWPKAKAKFYDDLRHALVLFATKGRTGSSRAVLKTEFPWLQWAFVEFKAGRLIPVTGDDGAVRMVEDMPESEAS